MSFRRCRAAGAAASVMPNVRHQRCRFSERHRRHILHAICRCVAARSAVWRYFERFEAQLRATPPDFVLSSARRRGYARV